MKSPLVSVCLPNLNTFPYLQERVDTIFDQTYGNWELIVSDNFSEDGAWPFFQELARRDSRVLIEQAPREGMYANWNNCIRRARGEYVYIATSDDTMSPDCLEKLVAALEREDNCGLAHCLLRTIDTHGRVRPNLWSRQSLFAQSSGELLFQPHVRQAPFDALLHLLGGIVYLSITQLLIRHSLFSKVGLFESRWGSIGDFNWEMRACLMANTVHVPDTWGGFRVHSGQATAHVNFESPEFVQKTEDMIEDALSRSAGEFVPRLRGDHSPPWCMHAREVRRLFGELARRASPIRRKAYLLSRALRGSWAARTHLSARLFGRPTWPYIKPSQIERWLSTVGVASVLTPSEV